MNFDLSIFSFLLRSRTNMTSLFIPYKNPIELDFDSYFGEMTVLFSN